MSKPSPRSVAVAWGFALSILATNVSAESGSSAPVEAISSEPDPMVSNSEQSTEDTANPEQSSEESSQETSRETSASTGSESSAPDDDAETEPDDDSDTEPSDSETTETDDGDAGGSDLVGTLVLASSLGTTIGVGVTIGIAIANASDKSAALELYLRRNTVAFDSDVSTGAGPVVDDLASFFEVSEVNRREFGILLRRLYPDLRPIVAEVDAERGAVDDFIRTVVEEMRRSPALKRDLVEAGFLEAQIRPLLHPGASEG